MKIDFLPLTEVDKADVLELMNHPKIRQHMPLLTGCFDDSKYNSFISAKLKMWDEQGYGPWAFTCKGRFIGWGGLQLIDHDVEIALVLHPEFWGQGKIIYRKILSYAFDNLGLESVIILFPPSRTRVKAILKLGFKPDGKYEFSGHPYIRYRLHRK